MDSAFLLPSLKDVKKAADSIAGYIHKTPVLTSELLNKKTGVKLFFKCENFQKSGAFKFRGACNTLLNLEQNSKPVITHSSGNHAGALAKAASLLERKCIVIMPENAPKVKVEAVKYYGADIKFCEPTLAARETKTQEWIEKTGALLVHPYNNTFIIAGQGTAALELLTDFPELDAIVAPIGGGGLMSGTSIAAKGLKRSIQVFGSEPKGADDAYQSFISGKIIPSVNPETIADGLLTSLGELTFRTIINYVDKIFTVEEHSIIKAMKLVWQYMKIVIEPSAAVPLAAILENKNEFIGLRTGIIFSGGNVDLNKLPF